jgi:hypothetical protein
MARHERAGAAGVSGFSFGGCHAEGQDGKGEEIASGRRAGS